MPIGGSATCSSVSWPAMVTTPSLPLAKSPPTGITVKIRKAGTKARYGASR